VRSVQWLGGPLQAIFSVELMESAATGRESARATLHVSVAGVPIGEVLFEVRVTLAADEREPAAADERRDRTAITTRRAMGRMKKQAASPEPVGIASLRYLNAFISYSRKDFAEVSFFAQGLDEAEVTVCIDVNAFEPGDEWAKALPSHICDADVFYLMWSENAAGSKWVDIETREAIRCYDGSQENRPRIKPIVLHQPYPPPPEYLRRFHFYSLWLAHRTAQAARRVRLS
jgi:TIR domain